MVRFDAYTATLKGPKPDDLMQILFDQVGLGAGFSKTRGFHTFGDRMAIKDGSGHEFGAIQWGGSQGDRLMFEVKGEHSQKAAEALRARYEHRVTRVDACADFDAPGAFEALLGPSIEVRRSAESWGQGRGLGRFPGEGPHPVHGQPKQPGAYEALRKGPAARIRPPEPAQLGSHRVKSGPRRRQRRPSPASRRWRSGAHPGGLGTSPRRCLNSTLTRTQRAPYRLTDRETALRWMCKQYGQHLASLAQDLGGWECVGLTLNEIMTAQAKGR